MGPVVVQDASSLGIKDATSVTWGGKSRCQTPTRKQEVNDTLPSIRLHPTQGVQVTDEVPATLLLSAT
ncbi:hypothetical protein E2C01_060618 [Portunus trituberculatus]|uniref:Uncharacterized protein n=1 Tax=Portunus trituberculatus TaxID=210409 RepID=A0A5B7H2Z9_PORTR|nr:hypothetical protein [Portunus trituberculatus]